MSESCTASLVPSIQNGGSFATDAEENFRPSLLGDVCREIWPDKTDAHVAFICDCTPRAARDYLNGKVAAPATLIAAIVVHLTRRTKG